ncbi:MAG: hypothetical protein ACPGU1_15830 [Myxococcota bacterium]
MSALKLLVLLGLTGALLACGEATTEAHTEVADVTAEGGAEDAQGPPDVTSTDASSEVLTPDAPEPMEVEEHAEVVTEADDATDEEAETLGPSDGSSVSDTAAPLQGTETAWGLITGACGEVTAAVQAGAAGVLQTTYTFDDAEDFDIDGLSGQTLKRYEEPNAGGSSRCTEVMSMQLLMDCEEASVLKTETEMVYDTEGKIADYLVEIGGVTTGVSVTRAYKGPTIDVYTLEDATDLLEKKLEGIAEARANVSLADAWDASLVHVWTLHPAWAETVEAAWGALSTEVKADTVIVVTVEVGSDYIVTDSCDD